MYGGWGWRPYVSVAERRMKAVREMEKRRKKGHAVSPVMIEGARRGATTSNATAILKTACRADVPTFAMAR
jgi:hypothetical protein